MRRRRLAPRQGEKGYQEEHDHEHITIIFVDSSGRT
jgi:hypothetical protein